MLSYFPAALPDELLYSQLARYHLHTCSQSAKQTLDDLFSSRKVRASVDLQCHLAELSNRIPGFGKGKLESLLSGTLLSYYGAFVPRALVKLVRNGMIFGPAAGIHARLGMAAGRRAPPARLRWCPECHAEARARYGESYWRRAHQLPSVVVCPQHAVRLQVAVLPERVGQHDFIAASAQTCPPESTTDPSFKPQEKALLLTLAHKSVLLLDREPGEASFASLTRACQERLLDAGLAKPSGRLNLKALENAASTRLAPLRPFFREAQSPEWLIAMGRKHRKGFSPLQHLLFDLVTSAPSAASTKRPNPKKRTFLADDPAFEQRLRAAATSETSLRGVARKLGVDPRTVLRHATRLNLDGPWTLSTKASQPAPDSREEPMKAKWHALHGKDLSRSEMRRMEPAVWVWLKRHCPKWLEENSPPPIRRSSPRHRIDWQKQDRHLAREVKASASILKQRVPPQRITCSAIEAVMDRSGWFGPRLAKLPECRLVLNQEMETLEGFRLRRIRWAHDELLARDTQPAPWRIQRLAGLPDRLSPRLKAALDNCKLS